MRLSPIPLLLLAAIPISFGLLTSVQTSSAPGMRANKVMLFRALPFEVRPGDSVTLDGSGFSKTQNKVYFNGGYAVTATSTNGVVIKMPIPLDLSEGQYKLSVSNVLGSSENPDMPVFVKITSAPQPGPTIKSASIIGDVVTLTGSGFTSANYLFTTLGNSAGSISSNGGTLTFRLTDLSLYNQMKKSAPIQKYQAALWIFIQNEHGTNQSPYKLDIII